MEGSKNSSFEINALQITCSSPVGIVILAAGASTRMGKPKQLLPYRGRSLLSHTVEVAIASVCRPIVVVLGADAEQIRQEVNQFPVQVVENFWWTEGMSASIRCGIQTLAATSQTTEAVVIALCDQPFISAQVINHLVETHRLTGKPIVASEYAGTLGVPALFSRNFFSELMSLKKAEEQNKRSQDTIAKFVAYHLPKVQLTLTHHRNTSNSKPSALTAFRRSNWGRVRLRLYTREYGKTNSHSITDDYSDDGR